MTRLLNWLPAIALVIAGLAFAFALVFEFGQIVPTQTKVEHIEKALYPCEQHRAESCRHAIDGVLASLSPAERRELAAKLAPYLTVRTTACACRRTDRAVLASQGSSAVAGQLSAVRSPSAPASQRPAPASRPPASPHPPGKPGAKPRPRPRPSPAPAPVATAPAPAPGPVRSLLEPVLRTVCSALPAGRCPLP